jgi:uncharacterized membrane protein
MTAGREGEPMLGTGERESGRDRDRIVNLSDGVFAIALTLLVLNVRVPEPSSGQ